MREHGTKVILVIDLAFAVPGDLQKVTGGYAYARKLFQLLEHFDVAAHHLHLPGSFPFPSAEDLELSAQIFRQVHPDTTLMIDGLAYGALSQSAVDAIEQRIIALVHHPLALESGLSEGQQRELRASETYALARASRIITTSSVTAKLLQEQYQVSAGDISVAEPGSPRSARAVGGDGVVQLLAVGAVIPRKDYLGLIEALKLVEHSHWQLTIVGATDHNRGYAQKVREAILSSGLRRQIELAGEVSTPELNASYASADIFVMSSRYEGYGMVLTEALARGLPIVCTDAGAMAETVGDDAAIKVPAGDAMAFAGSLQKLLTNPEERQRRADAAWSAAKLLPSWDGCARKVADVVKSLSGGQ